MATRKPTPEPMTTRRAAPVPTKLTKNVVRQIEAQPGLVEHLHDVERELVTGGGVLYEVRSGALRKVRRPG